MKNLSIFYGTFRAFSLVEMLMALLVASLLLAALAPVMTRKFGENVNVSGVGAAPKAPADIQCYSYNDAQPEVTVSVNDVYTASFVIASGGGGGAGATSETVKTWDETEKLEGVINGTGTGSRETKDIPITENMDKIVISHLIGGGGGGGYGNSDKTEEEKSFIPSPEVCKSYGTEKTDTVGNTGEDLATYDSANKLCVTKYNQKTTSSGNIFCSNNYDHSCNDNEGTYNGYAYSGCKRWICNHDGAVAACNVLKASTKDDWVLPTSSQAANFINVVKDLHICSYSNISGVSLCAYGSAVILPPIYAAYPSYVRDNAGGAHGYGYSDGAWKNLSGSGAVLSYPSAVRCVLAAWNDSTYIYKAYAGGGGGSASYLKDVDISTYVKQAGVGGKIKLVAGNGGKGATPGVNSAQGGHSQIVVYNKAGDIVYGLASNGAFGGSNASKTTVGAGGVANSCYLYNTSLKIWESTSCSVNGTKGSNGGSKVYGPEVVASTDTKATGGAGANSGYANSGSGSGGLGANNGSNAASYGAGGGGGGVRNDSTAEAYGNGGSGSGGIAEIKITYKETYPGAGGGGGGGGSLAVIKDLYVGNKAECTLTIGKGGKGGEKDNDGEDGSNSSVKCDTDTRTFSVPGGKKGLKGTSALNAASNVTGGSKGTFGNIETDSISVNIRSYNKSKREIINGEEGLDGNKSIGGRGGTSGTGTKGACGGLYEETDAKKGLCSISDTDNNRIIGKGFAYSDIITPTSEEIAKSIYGSASAGGGGGGYDKVLKSGKGGDGMGGYVCVYWYNTGN